MPWLYVFIGIGTGVGLIILDLYLAGIGSSFRTPVLAVAIGIYLPLELAVPIFAGGIIHQIVKSRVKISDGVVEEVEGPGRNGLLFASGLITGEALMGIILAIPIILLKQFNISLPFFNIDNAFARLLSLLGLTLPFTLPVGAVLGTVLLIGIAYWLYRVALGKPHS